MQPNSGFSSRCSQSPISPPAQLAFASQPALLGETPQVEPWRLTGTRPIMQQGRREQLLSNVVNTS